MNETLKAELIKYIDNDNRPLQIKSMSDWAVQMVFSALKKGGYKVVKDNGSEKV